MYSRNSEDNTSKYPDIIARMPRALKEGVVSCVIDAEAVAWDTEHSLDGGNSIIWSVFY